MFAGTLVLSLAPLLLSQPHLVLSPVATVPLSHPNNVLNPTMKTARDSRRLRHCAGGLDPI